ncbi:MAG: HEAT repeat domain-containing protein [Planctomycetaceae bacterium]
MFDRSRSEKPVSGGGHGQQRTDVCQRGLRSCALLMVLSAMIGCGSDDAPPAGPGPPSTTATAAVDTAAPAETEPVSPATPPEVTKHESDTASAAPPATPEQQEAEAAFREMTAEGVTPEDVDAATEKLLAIGAPAASILADELQSQDALRREMAATMLVLLGADASAATDQLILALNDESNFVRANAATALAQMEGHAAQVIPVYEEFLGGEDLILRKTMASNLSLLDAAAAKPLIGRLTMLLQVDDREVQIAAVEFLGRMGADAAEAVDAIKALDVTDDAELGAAVSAALASIPVGGE